MFPAQHVRVSRGFALFTVACALSSAAAAQRREANDPTVGSPIIEVQFADTFQGQSARLAVRACLDSIGADRERGAGERVRFAPMESGYTGDVVVRVLSGSGLEVSRHEGSHDVCGYARFAASLARALAKPDAAASGTASGAKEL